MRVMGIDHVAIAVNNIEEAVKIWEDMDVEIEYEIIEEQRVRAAIIHFEGERIEIIEPTCSCSPISSFLKKRGEGLHHLAIRVENIEGALEELEKKGYKLIDRTPRLGAGGKKIAFVHPKSAKILLELVED